MHTREMKDSEGEFGDWFASKNPCRGCGKLTARFRVWESHCGGYEDHKYECTSCGHTWWIEGSDS
jgi:hypothetical protein